MSLGDYLKKRRTELGLSLRDLDEATGVSYSYRNAAILDFTGLAALATSCF